MDEEIHNIIEKIASLRGLDVNSVKGHSALRDVCLTRYIAYAYLYNEKNIPAKRIGNAFGRTRINVLRGIRVLKGWMLYHEEIKNEYFDIIKKIGGA